MTVIGKAAIRIRALHGTDQVGAMVKTAYSENWHLRCWICALGVRHRPLGSQLTNGTGVRFVSKYSSSVDSVPKGILLISAAVFLLSLADAAVKYFSARLPLWQLFLIVSCLSVPTLGAWLGRDIKSGRHAIASVF